MASSFAIITYMLFYIYLISKSIEMKSYDKTVQIIGTVILFAVNSLKLICMNSICAETVVEVIDNYLMVITVTESYLFVKVEANWRNNSHTRNSDCRHGVTERSSTVFDSNSAKSFDIFTLRANKSGLPIYSRRKFINF